MTAASPPDKDDEPEDDARDSDEAASSAPRTKANAKAKPQPNIWQRAVYRWTAITCVMSVLLVIYTQHPYYKNGQFAPWRSLFPTAFVLWLALGILYCKATLEKFSERRYVMRDGGLHLLLLAKAFQQRRFWRVAKNRRVRTTLLGICVKAFFTPLMTGFVSGHAGNIADLWLRHKHLPPLRFQNTGGMPWHVAKLWWEHVGSRLHELVPSGADIAWLLAPWNWARDEWRWGLDVAYNFVFFVDCGVALVGYSSESRWLGNKTRSVEPTAFGWAVCLACYPPYNNVLGTYLPLVNGRDIITDEWWLLFLKGVIVVLFAVYASATVAFGFKFSNLTNRGIVMRGPYRLVRHPAYLCKCTAWWLEHLPTLTLQKAFFLTLLCCVYALRAWTEERHLSKDPDYLVYKKKTPWVLFPGVY